MDEAETRAEWEARTQTEEFRRRGQEHGKLALSLAKMAMSYASAFNGDDYQYVPICLLARVRIEDGHAKPEALEVVGQPEVPNSFIHSALQVAAQTLAKVPDGDSEYVGEVYVSTLRKGALDG